ncbi:hypothetical protein HMPREF9574_02385 [Cutibacterium acnes HL074PA1]|nr:hypothetical protein HMPREF9574_02385 [Cutibacterium acnes HL074PA1]
MTSAPAPHEVGVVLRVGVGGSNAHQDWRSRDVRDNDRQRFCDRVITTG